MMPFPEPGRMRDRIRIECATNTRSPAGQLVQTWSEIATVFAEIVDLTGGESLQARAVLSTTTHRVRIWKTPVVECGGSKLRAVVLTRDERILNAENVRRIGLRDEFLELDCTAVT